MSTRDSMKQDFVDALAAVALFFSVQHDACYKWVKAKGYNINEGSGSHRTKWGGKYNIK